AATPEAEGPPPIAAPAPAPRGGLPAWAGKAASALSGAWAKVKRGLSPRPPPSDLSLRIEKFVGRAPDGGHALETANGLLVHAPRGALYSALGYRLRYAPPVGYPAARADDGAVRVRVERGRDGSGTEALRARFEAFNALIESNFAALELIAQNPSKMTVKTAQAVIEHAETMAGAYAEMRRYSGSAEASAELAGLAIAFDKATSGLSGADPLPPAAAELILPLDKDSVHAWINRVHQEALREVGRVDAAAPANLLVKLGRYDEARAVPLLDLSEHPLVRDGRIVSPAFRALIEALRRSKDAPKGSLILQDHQFWGHFKLGAHSAEVYANFLPPDEGGMLRVRYQEWGTGYDNQTRLYYVARLLQKTGFHVEQSNGYLTAVVDKDHAAQTVDQMTDTFALVIQALHATVGVDFALPMLVKGAKSSEEVGRRIDRWVDVVLAEGTLPFYAHDDQLKMLFGWGDYKAKDEARALLRAALDKSLAGLGLPPIPAGEEIGQRSIDRFYNEPIEAALARGDLLPTAGGGVERVPGRDALAELARGLEAPGGAAEAARMGEAVSSLDPGLLSWRTIGSLGSLTVERAQRRLEPDAWLTVDVLRDPLNGQIGFARAWLSQAGGGPAPLRPSALFARLAEQGYPVAPFRPIAETPGLAHFERLLAQAPAEDLPLGRRVRGLAASVGSGRPMLARVTYDKDKAARGGYVFVAPYTTPDDLDAIRASKAVITTSGGLLSHAAITTREMGVPAVILPRADWNGGEAAIESPEFGAPRRVGGLVARSASGGGRAVLAEGALVRLSPETGSVEIYPPTIGAAVLDASQALARYDESGDGAALAAWARERTDASGEDPARRAA
ncbi:MAG: hypothetical protein KGM24_07985, partial [Elusimicrobia bacterium]|nr:hypothetical protein [Elusimicrobiota bacterium]